MPKEIVKMLNSSEFAQQMMLKSVKSNVFRTFMFVTKQPIDPYLSTENQVEGWTSPNEI